MITCTENNFGAGAISLNDYQSESLCVLAGQIPVDTTNGDYLAASRLELTLPPDFAMAKSAVSVAFLISPESCTYSGTIVRAWIEDRKLCIERLDAWDDYGSVTILLASGFAVLGYRGEFTMPEKTTVDVDPSIAASAFQFTVNEKYGAIGAYFSTFPKVTENLGPFSFKLDGVPTDIDMDIPLVPEWGNKSTIKPYGTPIITARLQNGYLHFQYPYVWATMGGSGTAISCFVLRGNYVPQEPEAGDISLGEDDVTPGTRITVNSFQFDMAEAQSMASLDASLETTIFYDRFPLQVKDYPKAALYVMRFPVLSRTNSSDKFRVAYNEMCWMKYHGTILFSPFGSNTYKSVQIFGTTMLAEIV